MFYLSIKNRRNTLNAICYLQQHEQPSSKDLQPPFMFKDLFIDQSCQLNDTPSSGLIKTNIIDLL